MKKPGLLISLLPVAILVGTIVLSSSLFDGDLTSGPAQTALVFAAAVGSLIAMFCLKVPWDKIEKAMTTNLKNAGGAIFILLMIGALTASWVQSGVVPSLVYYGLKIIHPSVFLIVIFVFTALVSLLIGSSWTTIGTIGVAMMSAGSILGLHPGWLAGAIISGSYFGDKISPLSDTTNLAASISGVKLYDHVKYMLITNVPSVIIAGVIFAIVGTSAASEASLDVEQQIADISSTYNVSPWLLLIPAFTIFLMVKKLSPVLTLLLSAVFASLLACILQPQIVDQISPFGQMTWQTFFYAPIKLMSSHIDIAAPNPMLEKLASTNGIGGMMNTIWLIISVTIFGGMLEAGGFIQTITEKVEKLIRNTASLVATTISTCVFCNIALSDQYMSIIIPGNMLKKVYKDKGYEGRLLSRSLEDSATVTSVLIPWNTCGAMQSGVLGVPTLVYAPYCLFNYISPLISIFVAAIGYKIFRWGKRIR
ncbi:MAG: sodium:proton antiporter [Bacteroidales bacterium]|nr:sodium:proton antiporter [Bacteroidales bacterium]